MTVVVASGKGGTGKTTVSVGLALSLAGEVTLLDCDVDAPNTRLFLGTDGATGAPETAAGTREDRFAVPVPQVDPDRCTGCGACASFCRFGALAVVRKQVIFFEDLCHACGGCTRVCPEGAIREVAHEIGTVSETRFGRLRHVAGELDVGQTLAPPLIRAVKERGAAATTIIDASPGTTCPVVEASRGADVGLLVTENTPFGLHDLELAAQVFAEIGLPAGIIVNRSGIGYEDESLLEAVSERFGFPVLMRIPYSEEIARAYAIGTSIVDSTPTLRSEFRRLHEDLAALTAGAQDGRP